MKRQVIAGFGWIGVGVLLFWAVIRPVSKIVEAERIILDPKVSPERQTELLLKKARLYGEAATSPLLRFRAQERAALLLRDHLNPKHWHDRIGLHVHRGSLSVRASLWKEALAFLQRLESALGSAGISLDHLRAYLALEIGEWEDLLRRSEAWLSRDLDSPQAIVAVIWAGHAAFFSARPAAAESLYRHALAAASRDPRWSQPDRHSWRLAGELQAVRYHLGLLSLSQGQAKRAASYLSEIATNADAYDRRPHRRPLWMAAHLWTAIAALRSGDADQAKSALQKAHAFSPDPTLPQIAAATWFRPFDRRLLERLAQTQRLHLASYADSPLLARAFLAEDSLRLQTLPGTLQGLHDLRWISKIFSRRQPLPHLHLLPTQGHFSLAYLPLPKPSLDRLIEAVNSLRSPYLPRSSASLPTSLPASLPAFSLSRPPTLAYSPHELWLWLRLQRALWFAKLSSWDEADAELQAIESEAGSPWEATFFRAMIAVERGSLALAQGLLLRLVGSPSDPLLGLWLAAVLLLQGQIADATKVLDRIDRPGSPWQEAIRVLRRGSRLRATALPRYRKAGFWLSLLGEDGRLARHDRSLSKQARFWSAAHALEGLEDLEGWLSLLRIGQKPEAFYLPDVISRYRLLADRLALRHPKAAREALRRWSWFTALYRQNPEADYLLDRMSYSLRWGALGLRLD